MRRGRTATSDAAAAAMYPLAAKIELFARRRRGGWNAWGNELARDGGDSVTLNMTHGAEP